MRPARKAIPAKLKLAVFQRQNGICVACRQPIADSAEYDHRPAIISRPVNSAGTDYVPPQLDPNHIEALHPDCHQQRTTGRKPGAERTATTIGSDIWLKTKFARLEKKARKPRTTITPRGFGKRLKQKIPSRPFRQRRKSPVDNPV